MNFGSSDDGSDGAQDQNRPALELSALAEKFTSCLLVGRRFVGRRLFRNAFADVLICLVEETVAVQTAACAKNSNQSNP